jgi:hypothetical protein
MYGVQVQQWSVCLSVYLSGRSFLQLLLVVPSRGSFLQLLLVVPSRGSFLDDGGSDDGGGRKHLGILAYRPFLRRGRPGNYSTPSRARARVCV